MKDPAALFYINDWLVATKEMKANERGWYLNLILHQFDKGDLPIDIEELANLADVRFSEYNDFKAKWEQVLKHKFKLNNTGRLENDVARRIIQSRELFKEKRARSGIIGYIVKFAKTKLKADDLEIQYIKDNIDLSSINIKDEQVLNQVLKHLIKLYRNENENENISINERIRDFEKDLRQVNNENALLSELEVNKFLNYWTEHNKNAKVFRREKETTWDSKKRLARWALNIKGDGKIKENDWEEDYRRDETPEEALKRVKGELFPDKK